MAYKLTTRVDVSSNIVAAINNRLHGGQLISGESVNWGSQYRFGVRCLKHPEYYQLFESSLLDHELITEMLELAQELIDKCPDCAYVRGHKTTRFPEGSEL